MKAQLTGKKYTKGLSRVQSRGFATLEILIAFVVLILCISATIMISFGNQSVAVDSQIGIEAISKAQALLEKARADSRFDFNLVNPFTGDETSGPLKFTTTLDVNQTDFFTKKVISTVSWQTAGKTLSTILTTILTNPEAVNGGDTCSSVLEGDWKNPEITTYEFGKDLIGDPLGIYTLTDVDAYKNKLYVTAGKTTNAGDPTLFVFDISNTTNPFPIGTADNASTVIPGLNAVRVSEDSTTGKTYAYAASNTGSNYSSCNPVSIDPITHFPVINPACGQLYIFDVTDPTLIASTNLKIISNPVIAGQNTGTSIFYKNGYLFLGLSANTNGPEFHIIDVHNPTSIFGGSHSVSPVGSFEVENGVNAIVTHGNYSYIASPNSDELQILNITNLNNPVSAGDFNSSTGGGNGKSLYLVGNKLYLGKTTGVGFDFHILDDTNPDSTLSEIAGINSLSSLNAITVRSNLAFLLSNNDLKIFDIGDPNSVAPFTIVGPVKTLTGFASGSSTEPSMDCESNRLYISSNDSAGQGSIYIIKPGP